MDFGNREGREEMRSSIILQEETEVTEVLK
jgi:hypothetical protein